MKLVNGRNTYIWNKWAKNTNDGTSEIMLKLVETKVERRNVIQNEEKNQSIKQITYQR